MYTYQALKEESTSFRCDFLLWGFQEWKSCLFLPSIRSRLRLVLKVCTDGVWHLPRGWGRTKKDNAWIPWRIAPAGNRTRGPTMATLDFTTKPPALITRRIFSFIIYQPRNTSYSGNVIPKRISSLRLGVHVQSRPFPRKRCLLASYNVIATDGFQGKLLKTAQ